MLQSLLPFPMPLLLLLSATALAQDGAPIRPEVPCYAPDGVTMADDSYRPCNNLGVLTDSGMFSSCCRLNAVLETRELCDARGLCIQGDTIRRGFCTDSSWDDPACLNYCMNDAENGSFNGSAALTSCNDGTFCCGSDNDDCCGTSSAFTIPPAAALTDSPQATVTETVQAVRAQQMTPFYVWIAMGASILFVMLLALGAMLFLLRHVRHLKKRNEELMEAAAIRDSRAPVLPRTPHVASMQEFREFNTIYGELLAKREKQEQEDREREKQREQDIERRRKMSMSVRSETDTMVGERSDVGASPMPMMGATASSISEEGPLESPSPATSGIDTPPIPPRDRR
ncbi:hypothetical protein jhhlp_005727 [Lomentospora prolificans]|uniref:Uncharacterized protein n=1 Tax=Lomentospora prolificans TaxID=41688 RepID=A0A2N3N3X3_9PEZI|nr:hypothetical protein jhhlp_005727 [Lomentospora prolificans]